MKLILSAKCVLKVEIVHQVISNTSNKLSSIYMIIFYFLFFVLVTIVTFLIDYL